MGKVRSYPQGTTPDGTEAITAVQGNATREFSFSQILETPADWKVPVEAYTYLDPSMTEAELAAAIAAGGNIRFLPGTYTFAAGVSCSNRDIRIEGAGPKFTLIRFQGSGTFITISQNSVAYKTVIKNLTLEPNRVAGPCALAVDISYPEVASSATSMVELDHLDIYSNTSATTPFGITWTSCLKLTNLWRPIINAVNFSSSRSLGKTDGGSFIQFVGGDYASIAAIITNCMAYFPHYGILCSGYTEGMYLSTTDFVGVTKGIVVPSNTAVGGAGGVRKSDYFWLSSVHINAWSIAIDLDTVGHLKCVNLDIGAIDSSTDTAWSGIKLNACMLHEIEGHIAGAALAGSEGLTITGGNNCSALLAFAHCASQFSVDSNHTNGHIIGLSSVGANRDTYTNNSTTTLVEWMNATGVKRVSRLNLTGVPTSASGLASGDVWSDGGTLKVVT